MMDKLKLLIIDDDVHFLDNLADILIYRNYDVKKARNGNDGLTIAKEFLPDLILCDVSMPELDGYQLLEKLKKNNTTFNIPFIFLTGKADTTELRHGMELGADDYLTKPVKTPELLRAIETRLDKHQKETGYYENRLLNIKKVVSTTLPHELRSPLNIILGFSQLISSHYDDFDKTEILGMLGNIENSGKKLLRLITNYNFYNRLVNVPESFLNSGKQNVIYSSMILDAIPQEIAARYERINDLKMEAANASVKITNECFIKLVEELTDNAFKFSPKDTPVTIKSIITEDKYILQFIDKGTEINEEQFLKIGAFEQFGRDEKEQQGAGMGLAIVSQIVNLWNGKLEITTKPDGITIFQITLPLSDEDIKI